MVISMKIFSRFNLLCHELASNQYNSDIDSGKKNGFVLFVCLIFLLILTILGVAGTQDTFMQEKMTGHLREEDIAFQAAESALMAGEAALATSIPLFTCASATDGLYMNSNPGTTADCPTYLGWPSSNQTQNPYPPDNESFWVGNTDVITVVSNQFNNLASPPKYVIEIIAPGKSVNQEPGQTLEADIPITAGPKYYRITAHGTGVTGVVTAVTQSVVRR